MPRLNKAKAAKPIEDDEPQEVPTNNDFVIMRLLTNSRIGRVSENFDRNEYVLQITTTLAKGEPQYCTLYLPRNAFRMTIE